MTSSKFLVALQLSWLERRTGIARSRVQTPLVKFITAMIIAYLTEFIIAYLSNLVK